MTVDPLNPPHDPNRRWIAVFCSVPFQLTVITLIGGALRFMYLSSPPLWGDEAATFRRICSSYQALVDELATGGLFTPLHYLLLWWIGQKTTLTPFMMRLVPAICGTLTIPAIYFLARQLVSKRAAMLAALLTACSAFMLNFSRDAKMYADLWLFATVHMACLFWWLRTRTRIAWWAWIASGIAMLGMQLAGAVVLPIELLIVLTARDAHWKSLGALLAAPIFPVLALIDLIERWRGRAGGRLERWYRRLFANFRWPPLVFFVLGIVLIGVAPYIYREHFNTRLQRVFDSLDEERNWQQSGITWLRGYNLGRTHFEHLRFAATAFLYNWEWSKPADEFSINERTRKLLKAAGVTMAILIALGLLPWRRKPRVLDAPEQGADWRRMFWVGSWLVLPIYGFYLGSLDHPASPINWITFTFLKNPPQVDLPALPVNWGFSPTLTHPGAMSEFFADWGKGLGDLCGAVTLKNINLYTVGVALLAAILGLARRPFDSRARLREASVIGIALAIGVLALLMRLVVSQPLPNTVWLPRYMGAIWPAFAILLSVLLLRLPTRPLRYGAIGFVLLVNLAQHGARVFAGSEPPVDRMARDVLDAQPPNSDSRVYYRTTTLQQFWPGTGGLTSESGRYYLAILSGKQVTPSEMRRGTARGSVLGFELWEPSPPLPQAAAIADSARVAPARIRKVIVWDDVKPRQLDLTDTVAERLGSTWRRTSDEAFIARDHWTWEDLLVIRRRVYERK